MRRELQVIVVHNFFYIHIFKALYVQGLNALLLRKIDFSIDGWIFVDSWKRKKLSKSRGKGKNPSEGRHFFKKKVAVRW